MKLYKEMLRKLMVVGLPLLIVTMIYTLVRGGSDCFGSIYLTQSTSAISQVPVLRYYVFTAMIFALYGFSFQFSRAGSDVYHSLPINRTEMYLSVLLATASWMGATIVMNELEMLAIYLISGCPFVPVYILTATLYYFVAAMMVFAAAAIGCAVSGTVITAFASTGIVLLLPRYVQFLFARGIVERVPIIGWLDFGGLLDPTTNAVTGVLAMHLRPVYNGFLITMPHILYSLLPLVVMLAAGIWLFKRRPSEIAQKNGGYRIWTIITAALLAFSVLLPITMGDQKLLSVYGAVLVASALGVFIVYQLIVSMKLKKVLFSLPYFAAAILAVLAVSGLIQTAADSMLNTTPTASQIESVRFRGFDYRSGVPSYTTLLVSNIEFTDQDTKEYVASSLKDAVDEIVTDEYIYDFDYNRFQGIEPVEIKLVGGGTIKRTIEFDSIEILNTLRMNNNEFSDAVHAFPPLQSVQYLSVDNNFTPEEQEVILTSYVNEASENGLLNGYYYRSRVMDRTANGEYINHGEEQSITGTVSAGFTGSKRYNDSYTIRLNTPETVRLLMRTHNSYIQGSPASEIIEAIDRFDQGLADDEDNLNYSISVFNYLSSDGLLVQTGTNFYLNNYMIGNGYKYDELQRKYIKQFADILSRAVLTDDVEGLFIRLDWLYRYEGMEEEGYEYSRPTAYLRFENEADEQEFLNLYETWDAELRKF